MVSAGRDVIYRLKVEYYDSNKKAFDRMIADQNAVQAAVQKTTAVRKKSATEEEREAKRVADAAERNERRVFVNRVKLLDQIAKARVKSEAEATRARERSEAEARRAAEATERQERRVFQNRVKLLDQIAKAKIRSEAEATRAAERAVASQSASQEKFKSTVLQSSDAVLRMARGIAIMAAGGSKDMEVLVQSIAKIQGAYDIVKGGIEAYHGITEAVKAYRAGVLAAAAAEKALGATRAASAVAGGASAAGSAAATGAAGTVASGGAIAAALIGVSAAAVVVTESLRGVALEQDSATMQIYEFENAIVAATLGLFGFKGDLDNYFDQQKENDIERVRQISEEAEMNQTNYQAAREGQVITFDARARSFQNTTQNYVNRARDVEGPAGAAVATRNMTTSAGMRIDSVRQQMGQARQQGNEALEVAAAKEIENLLRTQLDLTSQRLGYERESAAVKLDAARASIQAAQDEKKAAEDLLKVERERNMSVRERFGQLSAAEQGELISVRERADAVGAANLTREEREKLRSIGTNSATRLASEGDIAAGNAAGADRLFRAEDYQAERSAESRIAAAEVTIADQRRIEVQVEADMQNVVDQIKTIFSQKYEELAAFTEEVLKRETQFAVNQNRNQLIERRLATQAAGGR